MSDIYYQLTTQELYRMIVQAQPPNGHAPAEFGPYAALIENLHLSYQAIASANDTFRAAGKPEYIRDPHIDVRDTWDQLCQAPEYQSFALAIQQAQTTHPQIDTAASLDWLRDQCALIPANLDSVELRRLLDPVLNRIIDLPDEPVVVACLEELRRYFAWKRDTFQAYRDTVIKARRRKEKETRSVVADVSTESEELGETQPPPLFLSPALAIHNGVVYVSQMMAFNATKRGKRGAVTSEVWRPVIITSDRRRIVPAQPPQDAPDGAITWLDAGQRLALDGGMIDAPAGRWSYDSTVAFLHGHSEPVTAHGVFDSLMASVKQYIYHADESSYVVDVLWSMGTYFYRLWNAYPYLALHGEKGAGKTTLLAWLSAICFNAEFVVNTSEASLYRSIQAKAPTLLIDEQEGLNSSKAAKETKADLMGILKSGYKAGARVARQDMDRKEVTRYFDVYSPKALAAIELFEDVLENRAILTYMTRKPNSVVRSDDGAIIAKDASEFRPLRDSLYLLLMSQAPAVLEMSHRVKMDHVNRMRELLRPLYTMAALVDYSRGTGRSTLDLLDTAANQKASLRAERDRLSPEAMLRDAIHELVKDAWADASNHSRATLLDDGMVLCDVIQLKDAFESLFSNRSQSFFNDTWLGKQVSKMEGIEPAMPRRRRRMINERDPMTGDVALTHKQVSCYVIDPKYFS
jgi:hypothetical protein